jgi:hypothetical protein
MSSSAFPFESSAAPLAQLAAGAQARIGRCDAEVVSSSGDEVKLRHTGALKVGMEVVLSYSIGITRLQSAAVVRSCHVLALGGAGGATVYETLLSVRSAARAPQEETGFA